jgi:glycosyltransferase involved in cell wall biosynthesis
MTVSSASSDQDPGTILGKGPQNILYVLNTFPKVSETFVSEEIASLCEMGKAIVILRRITETSAVNHPVNHKIIATCPILDYRETYSTLGALVAIANHLMRKPGRFFRFVLPGLLSRQERWKILAALKYFRHITKHRIEYIHAHFADKNLAIAKRLSDLTAIPYGVTTHHYDLYQEPIPEGQMAYLLSHADINVTISEFNRRHIKQRLQAYGYDRPTDLIHCGIRTEFFNGDPLSPPKAGESFRFLSIGRLEPAKGYDILLNALALARQEEPNLILRIIGSGSEHESLVNQTRSLGLADHVIFLGALGQDEVKTELSQCHVFVMGSRSEGLPIVIMEAMAMRRPVIAPDIKGIPEIIRHGENGYIFSAENEKSLAQYMIKIVRQGDAVAKMGELGRRCVEEQFERSKSSKALIDLITRRLNGPAIS